MWQTQPRVELNADASDKILANLVPANCGKRRRRENFVLHFHEKDYV